MDEHNTPHEFPYSADFTVEGIPAHEVAWAIVAAGTYALSAMVDTLGPETVVEL